MLFVGKENKGQKGNSEKAVRKNPREENPAVSRGAHAYPKQKQRTTSVSAYVSSGCVCSNTNFRRCVIFY